MESNSKEDWLWEKHMDFRKGDSIEIAVENDFIVDKRKRKGFLYYYDRFYEVIFTVESNGKTHKTGHDVNPQYMRYDVLNCRMVLIEKKHNWLGYKPDVIDEETV